VTALRSLFALCLALVATQTSQAQQPAWHQAVDSLMTAELARTLTPGAQVAIAIDGKVVYSRAFGVADIETGRPVTTQTLFRVGSVTKMVAAAVLTDLAVEGKLDLNAPISRYVTELAGRRAGAVTSHQLLTHTAGWIDNAIPYGRMGEGALGEVMREVSDTLFFTEPGRVISYSNPGFSMAGYVAERAGGARFGALADERVLRKFGMPHASFRPLEVMTRDFSQGHVGMPTNPGSVVRPFTENTAQWAAGFLMASAQDMARFSIALMDNGMLDGQRVMSAEAVRMMTTGYAAIPGDSIAKYGYGLSIGSTFGTRTWQHGGSITGFDANVTMFPDKRIAIVITDNRAGSPVAGLNALVAREVAKLVVPTPSEPAAPRAPTAAERAAIAGNYAQGRRAMEFAVEGNALVFRQGNATLPVQMIGTDRITFAPPGGPATTMILVRDAQGRIVFLHQSLRAMARQ
jgi:CubicO group peptidase (beta-lactamase class C family)